MRHWKVVAAGEGRVQSMAESLALAELSRRMEGSLHAQLWDRTAGGLHSLCNYPGRRSAPPKFLTANLVIVFSRRSGTVSTIYRFADAILYDSSSWRCRRWRTR